MAAMLSDPGDRQTSLRHSHDRRGAGGDVTEGDATEVAG
jgi:hypothetical protein